MTFLSVLYMTIVYIDESGDLGMSSSGSKYFIISAVSMDPETNR